MPLKVTMRSTSCAVLICFVMMLKFGGSVGQSKDVSAENREMRLLDIITNSLPVDNDKRLNTELPQINSNDAIEVLDQSLYENARIMSEGLQRLMNTSTVEAIIESGVLYKNGRPVTAGDLGAVYDEESGKMVISGSEMAVPDECSPRESSFIINGTKLEADKVLFPTCIKVMRCGGCCSSLHIECRPATTQQKVVHHTSCRCVCLLSQESCGPNKEFFPNQCACHCKASKVAQRCSYPKTFNQDTCTCECHERIDCCRPGEMCMLEYNEQTCDCELAKWAISDRNTKHSSEFASIDLSSEEGQSAPSCITDGSSSNQGPSLLAEPATITAATTTTSALTTTTITGEKNPFPCPTVTCPRNFEKRVNSNGLCLCALKLRG